MSKAAIEQKWESVDRKLNVNEVFCDRYMNKAMLMRHVGDVTRKSPINLELADNIVHNSLRYGGFLWDAYKIQDDRMGIDVSRLQKKVILKRDTTQMIAIIDKIYYDANNEEILCFFVKPEDKDWPSAFIWDKSSDGYISIQDVHSIEKIEACK